MDVVAPIAYCGRGVPRPRYHANAQERDVLDMAPVAMTITDTRRVAATLDVEGFTLVAHGSAVQDFLDRSHVDAVHRNEIAELVASLSGADEVRINAPGLLRFSERSGRAGALDNSRPARFAHVDISDLTAAQFNRMALGSERVPARVAHYNVWRAVSGPPQDVPLAVCDARSVDPADLILADAVFDSPDKPEWSFEGVVVAHNPRHRWCWYPDMTRDEAIVFKTHDSDLTRAHCVPHVAFDNPACASDAAPRVSLEMRAMAIWWG